LDILPIKAKGPPREPKAGNTSFTLSKNS